MKLKNVNFFQKYVDLIAIGVCVLVALWILWQNVLSSPYTAEHAGQTIAPADLPRKQAEIARSLQVQINSDENPIEGLPESIADMGAEFVERLARPHFESTELAYIANSPLPKSIIQFEEMQRYALHVPTPPKPSDVRYTRSDGVMAEPSVILADMTADLQHTSRNAAEVQRQASRLTEELFTIIDNPDPRDFAYVTVGAKFDFSLVKEAYAALAPAGFKKIPDNWWYGSLVITDVILERETLDEASGQWTDRTIIAPLPGKPDLRTERTYESTLAVDAAMNTIATYQDELSNPRFPTLTEYSRPWVSPFADKKQLTADERREILQLKGDKEKVLQQLEQMGERVERRANVTRRRRPTGDPLLEMDPTMIPGGNRGGRPVRPSQGNRPTPQRDANAERLAQLQQRLDEIEFRLAELTGEDEAMSTYRRQTFSAERFMRADQYGPMMDPMMMDPMMMDPRFVQPGGRIRPNVVRPGNQGDPGQDPENLDLLSVWAHDLTVEPGRTYRYRVIVSILNPLFQRRNLTEEQHAEYFHKLSLQSEPSEWTEPIRIANVPELFLTNVDRDQTKATFEVWRVFDGMPQKVEFTAAAGDPIGGEATMKDSRGVERTLRLETGAVVVDVFNESLGARGNTGAALLLDGDTQVMNLRRVDRDSDSDARSNLRYEAGVRAETMPFITAEGTRDPRSRPAPFPGSSIR